MSEKCHDEGEREVDLVYVSQNGLVQGVDILPCFMHYKRRIEHISQGAVFLEFVLRSLLTFFHLITCIDRIARVQIHVTNVLRNDGIFSDST